MSCLLVASRNGTSYAQAMTAGDIYTIAGNGSPGFATFQKGVTDSYVFPEGYHQNEESSNLPKWDYYRRTMGWDRNQRTEEQPK